MKTEVVTEIKRIREDLDILTNLYSKLVNRLLPEEEPEAKDLKALKESDEIVNEEELFKVLSE